MGNTPNLPIVDSGGAALDRKRELDIKEREVAAKEREVLAKEEELKRSRWLNPTVIGLFAATLGLMGNVIVARVNNENTQKVERVQNEANVTLEAIKTGTGNTDAACKNLLFFVSLGLISDPDGRIGFACAAAPKGPPSLPAYLQQPEKDPIQIFGHIEDLDTLAPVAGALVKFKGSSFESFSAEDGSFTLQVPPGRHWGYMVTLEVRKAGYLDMYDTFAVTNLPVELFIRKPKPDSH
jgi:hypothetical protein